MTKNNIEFIISEILDRIKSIRKRLDRLIYSLIFVSIFGFINFNNFDKIEIFKGIKIINNVVYHMAVVVILTILFAMIGALLIEYVDKRSRLEKILENESYFPNYKFELEVSLTLIPGSFYEFMYALPFQNKDFLRKTAVLSTLFIFICSHYIAMLHIYILTINNLWFVLFFLIVLIFLILLYNQFIKSLKKTKKELGEKIRKLICRLLLVAIPVLTFFTILCYTCL